MEENLRIQRVGINLFKNPLILHILCAKHVSTIFYFWGKEKKDLIYLVLLTSPGGRYYNLICLKCEGTEAHHDAKLHTQDLISGFQTLLVSCCLTELSIIMRQICLCSPGLQP